MSGAPSVYPAFVATLSRLYVIGVPEAIATVLEGVAAGEVLRIAGECAAEELSRIAPGPSDAIVLFIDDPENTPLSRINTLHTNFPRVPLLALVSPAAAPAAPILLSAGVQEIVEDPAHLHRAITLARGRLELLAAAANRSSVRQQRFDGLFPNLYDWIYVVGVAEDGSLFFETVNPPLHGPGTLLNPDFEGQSPEACLEPELAATLRSQIERVLAEGAPLQFDQEQMTSDGRRSYQTILTPVRNKWGRIHRIAAISRDTTSLTEAQAALRASEERLALALEGTQQGLWDWDVVHGVVYRSPRWFEMLGLAEDDVESTFEAGLARIHPDDRDSVQQAVRLHLDGHLPRFQAEYRIRNGSGDWVWLFDAGKIVSWSEGGEAARITGLCTDISDRRRAEESLRALVGGVVHEMRNPAFGIGMNLDALEATFGEDPKFAPFVAALRESCSRILNLMNDLRDYGEPRTLRAEPCRLRTVVDQAVLTCAALANERSTNVVVDFEDSELVLPLHAFRMHQVFRNLIENALYHSPAGTNVMVSCRRDHRARESWAVLSVSDSGPGFDAIALTRAFEPFFTRRKGGTGLGLSIVRRVVEEHGGSVTASNRPGAGAIVTLRLPIPRTSLVTEIDA